MAKKPPFKSEDLLRLWPWGVIEHKFHPLRQWRFDWAMPSLKLAFEMDGRGHNIWSRWRSDMTKFNNADKMGWVVYHVTHYDVESGMADAIMQAALKEKSVRCYAEFYNWKTHLTDFLHDQFLASL